MAEIPTLELEIVTPYELLFDGPVETVIITLKDGEIGILPGHASLMAALVPGEIRFKVAGQWQYLANANGFAEIGPNVTILVVNAAEWAKDINVPRAENALQRAKARLADPQITPRVKIQARHAANRAKARLKVAAHVHPPE